MAIGASGVLSNGVAGATFSGGLTNDGVVFASADTFFNGAITNTGQFSFRGAVSNNFVNRNTATLTGNATLTAAPVNSGTLNAAANTLTVNKKIRPTKKK